MNQKQLAKIFMIITYALQKYFSALRVEPRADQLSCSLGCIH